MPKEPRRRLAGLNGSDLYDALHPKPGSAATAADMLAEMRAKRRDARLQGPTGNANPDKLEMLPPGQGDHSDVHYAAPGGGTSSGSLGGGDAA